MAQFGSGIEKYISRQIKLRIMAGETPQWMKDHIRGRYIIKSTLAAPLWMHRNVLKPLREEATRMTLQTGVYHVLDHCIPVDHPEVCGLTVPWNMRVIPYAVNASKNNQWHPDQEDMFTEVRPEMHPFLPMQGQGMFVIA